MNWLVPILSHSLSSLYAWFGNTLTPSALFVSFLLALPQSSHQWTSFYTLFAVFFLSGTCLGLIKRNYISSGPNKQNLTATTTRTATYLIANVLISSLLVLLHQQYMKQRLSSVPWFNILRAPSGCLPLPSRTLTAEPTSYTFKDALGNQLPFAIVVSYAVAMGNTFTLGSISVSNWVQTTLTGAAGALLMAFTAAYSLPMCEESMVDGTLETMMHVDRSTAWEERTVMTWTHKARFGWFVVLVTVAGTAGVVSKQMLQSRKLDGDGASFCSNLLVTASVVFGMAIWSFYC